MLEAPSPNFMDSLIRSLGMTSRHVPGVDFRQPAQKRPAEPSAGESSATHAKGELEDRAWGSSRVAKKGEKDERAEKARRVAELKQQLAQEEQELKQMPVETKVEAPDVDNNACRELVTAFADETKVWFTSLCSSVW